MTYRNMDGFAAALKRGTGQVELRAILRSKVVPCSTLGAVGAGGDGASATPGTIFAMQPRRCLNVITTLRDQSRWIIQVNRPSACSMYVA